MPERDPYQAEPDDHVCTVPLEDEDGESYRVCQEPVGAERVVGGGEFPSPSTPPQAPAPGSAPSTGRGDEPPSTGPGPDAPPRRPASTA